MTDDAATTRAADRRWFRRPATVAAVCVVGLGLWAGIAVFGGDDREIRMEVTSTSGEVEAINWRGPDDNNKTHEVSDSGEPIETPWSERIEVASERGVIVLTALAPLGATATCRLLVGDKVLAEESGRPIASCMVTPQRAFPAS